jgi:hypothetical protein
MIYISISILTIILATLAIIFMKYRNLSDLEEAILKCDEKLNEYLTKKNELINKVLKNINNEKLTKTFNYKDEDSIYDKEDTLFNIRWDINKFLLENPKISKKIKKETNELNEIDDNIEGLKDFYNANVINYNELFMKKPLYLIYKILKFDQYKSFKLRKLDDYEILKN